MTLPGLSLDYRRRAILALLAAIAFAVLLAASAASTLLGAMADARTELREARAAIAARSEGTQTERQRAELTRQLVPGATIAEAQANLQTMVKALAQQNGADVTTLQPLPARRAGGLVLTRLQLLTSIQEFRLPRFLAALAAANPALVVAGLEISPEPQLIQADGTFPPRRSSVRLDIIAFAQGKSQGEAGP